MYGERPEDVFYYLTVYNEPKRQPPLPSGPSVEEGILRGVYRFRAAPSPEVNPGSSCCRPGRRSTGRSRPRSCWPMSGACGPTCGR